MSRHLACFAIVLAVVLTGAALADGELHRAAPEEILAKLDLTGPGLEAAQRAHEAGDRNAALGALLDYYRRKHPLPEANPPDKSESFPEADQIARHVFQWGPYEPADYGHQIDWAWDPRGDIEWVAAVYRFYWAMPLAEAYRATRDDKYVAAFVELTSDWIAKHPLENRGMTHPVYTSWRGYPWLDIQTGIRADSICKVFPVLVHGRSFTPEFLGILLASLYDHQAKTEREPMRQVHNKAVFEQRGFVHIASLFPEFKDARRWMQLALDRTRENFLAQTTPDGVQREWSFGYNLAVLRDAVDIMERARPFGLSVPGDYLDRIRKMYDYIFAVATPRLSAPMFGDASRTESTSSDRSQWPLYETLTGATRLLGDPKYAALAKLDAKRLPEQTSYAFAKAGTYVLRDQWGPEQIYFALHCPPPGISGHDQPDNGTFELCAFGRWLMPDTGFYTYGHDPQARTWHRQTRVHQTLTLDGRNARIDGRQLLWKLLDDSSAALVVENASYPGLVHRRTVWFVDGKFFVMLDEAIGDAQGNLDLHFQLAPGEATINLEEHWAATAADGANVLVWQDPQAPVTIHEEEGWHAWKYGHREPRKAFCYRHTSPAPAAFLSVILPFQGAERPRVAASLAEGFEVAAERVECRLETLGNRWKLGRSLNSGDAWCTVEAAE